MFEITELAKGMLEKQSFHFKSFIDAKDAIEYSYSSGKFEIIYDRLSLCIYTHNLTDEQFFELGTTLDGWDLVHNIEDQKTRIEYGILFHYAQLHPEILEAIVVKDLHPDFRIFIHGKNIGIEITRLEKEDDNVMHKIISKIAKPGLTVSEIMKLAKKEHGKKAEKFEVQEIDKDLFVIFSKEEDLVDSRSFDEKISAKIEKYLHQIAEFDEFVILCNAVQGIEITSELDVKRMIDRVRDQYPKLKMKIEILYLSPSAQLQCYESLPD